MRASVTSAIATSPRARGGAAVDSQADSPPSRTAWPRPSETWTCKPSPPPRPERCRREEGERLLSGSTVSFVRLHDLLHERVPDHVLFVEMDEGDPLDIADDLHRFYESRLPCGWQIDLRDVAGDHRFGSVAEAGQEHLHLL